MSEPFYVHYKCSKCGEEHVGAPSFAFDAPAYYNALSDEDKRGSFLSSDGCVILDRDFFIRTILQIPIRGTNEVFMWGVWVSQSMAEFQFYNGHFKDDLTGRKTFGWFSSLLPEYESTLGLKTTVLFKRGGLRPQLHLEDSPHQLSIDFHRGISIERATQIAGSMLHRSQQQ